jgi:hypothetical protein
MRKKSIILITHIFSHHTHFLFFLLISFEKGKKKKHGGKENCGTQSVIGYTKNKKSHFRKKNFKRDFLSSLLALKKDNK